MPSKKALLIGINYTGTDSALNGCINDVDNMKQYLLSIGVANKDINIMTDTSVPPNKRPTRKNIIYGILDLILTGADHLFIHYSGHGGWEPDQNGDEADNRDENIIPLDYLTEGIISDDQLRALLAFASPQSTITIILDCCHSGTGIDLKYNLQETTTFNRVKRGERWERILEKKLQMVQDSRYQITNCPVVAISGCLDPQTSADAYIDGKFQGALTSCFLTAVKQDSCATWLDLITEIRKLLQAGGYTQIANLTSGQNLDLNTQHNFK